MLLKTYVVAAVSLAAIPSGAEARDVNMMRFGQDAQASSGSPVGDDIILSRSAALGSNPFVDSVLGDTSVNAEMRAVMENARASTMILSGHPLDAIDLENLPTSNLTLPAWMRASKFVAESLPSATIAATGCDGASYKPAWWLSRAAQGRRAHYFPTMAAIACEYGVPTLMFDALIAQESGYNPTAISSMGAAGMSQIIPGTARYLGLYSPFDPVLNMRAGARYLKEQLDRFGGRSDLALAAYNAGPGRVQKKLAVPRIRETVHYVNVITLNWARLANMHDGTEVGPDRGQLAAAVVDSFPYRRATFLSFTRR